MGFISEWIWANKEWLFSGVGIVILGAVVGGVMRWKRSRSVPVPIRPQKDNAAGEDTGPSHQVRSKTPAQIMAEFKRAPVLQRKEVAAHYRGIVLTVDGPVHNSWSIADETTMQLSGPPSIFLAIEPERWPGLTLLREGERVAAVGPITEVSEYGITIKPTELEY